MKKPVTDSRGSQIDLDRCVELAGSRYDLIIAASQRLREQKRQARDSGEYRTPVDTLLEMQQGRIDMLRYLSKVK